MRVDKQGNIEAVQIELDAPHRVKSGRRCYRVIWNDRQKEKDATFQLMKSQKTSPTLFEGPKSLNMKSLHCAALHCFEIPWGLDTVVQKPKGTPPPESNVKNQTPRYDDSSRG